MNTNAKGRMMNAEVKERPILFSGQMICAIWDNLKTQTRRIIKMRDGSLCEDDDIPAYEGQRANYVMDFSKTYPQWERLDCPYGVIGDRLWVRETWNAQTQSGKWWHEVKREDRPLLNWAWTNPIEPSYEGAPPRWLPGIHMPRAACRIILEIVDVRVERVKEISLVDIEAEGTPMIPAEIQLSYRNDGYQRYKDFEYLWDSINAKRGYGWNTNPFVWVLEFKNL